MVSSILKSLFTNDGIETGTGGNQLRRSDVSRFRLEEIGSNSKPPVMALENTKLRKKEIRDSM